MILFLLSLFALLVLSLIRFSASEFLAPVAETAHIFCLRNLPYNSEALSELKALVCAENFSSLTESNLYVTSGLIHLFVVSGAHLILLEQILLRGKLNSRLVFSVLLLYGFACNLSAPVSRALIAYTLNSYLTGKNIQWPAHFRLLIAGTFTLNFNFTWVSSLSLQMSWLAAFLVMLGQKFFKNTSLLFKQSLFFLTLLPTLVFFQIPSPLIIILNIILAPVLEFFLFPLGLLTWFAPPFHNVFDASIRVFKKFLVYLEMSYQIQINPLPENLVFYNWVLIFVLHSVFHLLHLHHARKTLHET